MEKNEEDQKGIRKFIPPYRMAILGVRCPDMEKRELLKRKLKTIAVYENINIYQLLEKFADETMQKHDLKILEGI